MHCAAEQAGSPPLPSPVPAATKGFSSRRGPGAAWCCEDSGSKFLLQKFTMLEPAWQWSHRTRAADGKARVSGRGTQYDTGMATSLSTELSCASGSSTSCRGRLASSMLGHLQHCGHWLTQQGSELTTGTEQLKTKLSSTAALPKLPHGSAGLVSLINLNQKA